MRGSAIDCQNSGWNRELLDSAKHLIEPSDDLHACLNAHGLYNALQVVLRLSPEVHRKIAAIPNGIVRGIDVESLQAYSTYLHETIHWWQHIGSTAGIMRSLSYPAEAHANYGHLKKLLNAVGPKKSILRLSENATAPGGDPDSPEGLANIVVNNHFDMEFFRQLTMNPKLIEQIAQHPQFDCIGHSCEITYGEVVLVLASTLDPNFQMLPDPRTWNAEFAKLRTNKDDGYFPSGNIAISPIGSLQIFEGQARFTQLQYLHFGSGGSFTWNVARSHGMLAGYYVEAFEVYLREAKLDWPSQIDHPVVALFLLICDIALNPGAGFPMPLHFFKDFINDVDPGIRFIFLCNVVAQQPSLAQAIKQYSRAEYVEVSESLTRSLSIDSPLSIAATVVCWVKEHEKFKSLVAERESFDYSQVNLPVHFLFSHFLAFSRDKFLRPEFFCWPGAWMAGAHVSSDIENLFNRHSAPFMDKLDDEGIYPRVMDDKSESSVMSTFNSFYAYNVTYDLTRQWVSQSGPFRYEYDWLSSSGTTAELKTFADRHFEQVYGVQPDLFEIL